MALKDYCRVQLDLFSHASLLGAELLARLGCGSSQQMESHLADWRGESEGHPLLTVLRNIAMTTFMELVNQLRELMGIHESFSVRIKSQKV